MVRRLIVLCTALVLMVMLGACSPATSSPTPASQATAKPAGAAAAPTPTSAAPAAATAKPTPRALEKIKYMTPTGGISFLAAYLGKEKGVFAGEGLDPEFIVLKGQLGIPSLLSGEVDYSGQITEALLAAMAGEPTRLIMVQKSKASWRIIFGQGVTAAQQIKGKAVGISTMGGSAQYVAEKSLKSLGLDPAKDFTFVALADKDIVAGLMSGSIAAAVVTPPFSDVAVASGFKEALNTSDVVDMASTGVSTTIKKIQSNPDQVKRLVRAFLKSLAYVKDHQEDAVQLSMANYDLERPIAEKVVAGITKEYSYNGTISDKALEATLDIMKAGGGPGKDATLEQLKKGMDFSVLNEAQKELGITR